MPIKKISIAVNELSDLIRIIAKKGYRTIGPIVRDKAIVYDDITSAANLPQGWTDEQNNASYRLKKRDDEAYFGYTLGVQSWKRFLHQPLKRFWSAFRENRGFRLDPKADDFPKMSFIGVRPCELRAIAILDKVLLGGPYRDYAYANLRKNLFIVAVNCSHAGGTCFCASVGSGPKAASGYDLALTELVGDNHRFLIEVGSDAGAEMVKDISGHDASQEDIEAADSISTQVAKHMGKSLESFGLRELFGRNTDAPRWEMVAKRCFSCGNCTMICPTCFCTIVEDSTDLSGVHANRDQKWDSCFTVDFSYIHGGSIRPSAKSRYRQWATHKFGSWQDQFDSIGCVGCGRCITWCPAAIDITEGVRAIRESERSTLATPKVKETRDASN